jgi:hypothetical protein
LTQQLNCVFKKAPIERYSIKNSGIKDDMAAPVKFAPLDLTIFNWAGKGAKTHKRKFSLSVISMGYEIEIQ